MKGIYILSKRNNFAKLRWRDDLMYRPHAEFYIYPFGFNLFEDIINVSFKLCIFYNLYRHALESTSFANKLSYGCLVDCVGISHLTGKPIHDIYHPSAVLAHRHECYHSPSFDIFSILTSDSNDFKLTLKESLLINRDKPPLNRTIKSLPLEIL